MRSISSTVTHRAQEPVDMVYARLLERCLSTSPRHLRLSLGSLSENQHRRSRAIPWSSWRRQSPSSGSPPSLT